MQTILSKRLKDLRYDRQLKQSDVARAIGCTYQAVSNYESGKRAPGIPELIALANFYNVSIDYLVGRTDNC